MKTLLTLVLAFLAGNAICQKNFAVISPDDSPQKIIEKAANVVPSERQLRWQRLEMTAFFHFGINTFTNREWGTGKEDPKLFNPSQLNTDQWVNTAKNAGFKLAILTAKHHDGFCLWPTATTNHSVKSSPWKNGKGDVVKEMADACRRAGMEFGIYLSPWDMNAPSYGTDEYNDFFVKQLTELLTNYGTIHEVWFDGANGEGPNGKKKVYDFDRWYKLIRKLQPKAVIAIMGPDVRWVGTETGYGRETEWSVVPADNLDAEQIAETSQQTIAFKPSGDMRGSVLGSREKILGAKGLVWYPAETDVSIRPGWFYHPAEDDKVKTPEKLLDIYFHSVGRNGVLLLNLPPDTSGLIAAPDIETLRKWKQMLDDIFSENLLEGAQLMINSKVMSGELRDKNPDTYWRADKRDTTATIVIKLPKMVKTNVLRLSEPIKIGQRIEEFRLEYRDEGNWKIAGEGTTVGYKRLLQFPAVEASEFRLKILSSRLNPSLSEIGLYKE